MYVCMYVCIYIYIYIHTSHSLYIYIYIYMHERDSTLCGESALRTSVLSSTRLHPVRNPRFASFRTQPLENLSAAVKLPIKYIFLGNPTLGTNLGQRILAMRTGCTPLQASFMCGLCDRFNNLRFKHSLTINDFPIPISISSFRMKL